MADTSLPPPEGPPGAAPAPPSGQAPAPGVEPPRKPGFNTKAIIAFVASLLYVFGLGSLAGVALGALALRELKDPGRPPERGRGLAITGIVLGALGLLATIAFVWLVTAFTNNRVDSYDDFAQIELRVAGEAQEQARAATGSYLDDLEALEAYGFVVAPHQPITIVRADATTYCMQAVNDIQPSNVWSLQPGGEPEPRPCP